MKMATETTPLTSGDESRTYLFLSQRHRNRRNKIRQFQCCVCAAMLGIFVTAMVITVSYSMNHDPDDDLTNNETDTNTQVLLPAPVNTAALKTLLSLQWPRPDSPPPDWPGPIPTDAQIAEAIEAGEMSLKNKDDLEAKAAMKSDDPASPGILKLGTPSYIHQEAIKTSPLATKAARVGYIIEKATEQLMKGKSPKHSVGKGPEVNPYWIPTGMVCRPKGPTGGINGSFAACPPLRYRTMDGTCNNLVHPDWGAAMRPLRRVLPPDYGDGISSPRVAKDGSGLPSARDVSLTVHRPIYRNDPHFTVMLAVWGQFFDHDITATALSKSNNGAAISCCTLDGMMATENVNPECYPVVLSPEDPYYSDYGITCMNFVRSAPAPTCNLGSREQLNQITSFIDGSVIYGSSDEQAKHLRSPSKKGELAMMITPDGRELLPASLDPRDGCNQPDKNADGKYCFKSGDSRANENLHLTTMHLLMAREHNRIVRALSKMNPSWSDEQLYQEGRHIVSAQLQHITYNEFLPVVLGQSMMNRLKLAPLEEGYFKGYDPEVNSAVANNFATAAFRFAHTLLPTLMKILGNDTSSEEYVELHKILFNPYALYYPGKMDSTLKGALNTDVQRVDTYITPEVTQHLFQQKWSEDYDNAMEKAGSQFKGKKKGYGLDLASLNVQRGRDHGLPSYPEWREHCGLSRPYSFSDLNGEMDEAALERLASLYKTVDDVDMYSGSLSEIPVGEGLLGPTFSCLIADQFLRLKTGDRYWYETSELPQAFTPEQLAEIRRISLASIICENSGIDRVQQRVMQAVDDSNPRIMCEYIPQLHLEAWRDKSMVGRVKLSPFSMHVKVAPKKLQEPIPSSVTAGSLFIKGTVASASINALGSDGTAILAMQPSTTFPMMLPVHLFDQKVPVSASTDFPDGIIPPFYHGGGGVTWTGSLTSSDPTKAHLEGSFSVPVFKHGATAFDFSIATYTGSFDIYLNLASSFSPLGVPTLQGTYNSGIYFKTELSTMDNSQPTIEDYENLMAESDTSGPKLPVAPVFLYGTYSLDHTEFYWDGNVSIILPSPMMPIVTASMGGMIKPKIASIAVDVSAVWGVVKAVAGPPLNPVSGNSKTVVTTWWDGTLPVAIPQPAFDRTVAVPATSKVTNTGDGVTWSGSLTPVDGSDDVQLNGTFSFPVFHHGVTLSGFTLQIWRGNFSIILRSSPTLGVMPLAMSLRSLGTGDTYKSPLYFRAGPEEMTTLDDDSTHSNLSIPVILHGHTSIDKSIFYWNGNASIIVPKSSTNVLMAQERGFEGHGGGESKYHSGGFDKKPYRLQATGGSPAEPLILTITSASVRMSSTINTNTTGKNITWNGEFPVTLPQSPFYRKGPLALSKSNIDTDSPYSPLAASAGSAAVSYKSELTWSNLSGKMIDSSTNDLQINGSLSFPVYYFPSVTVGPWPGPTIENWIGNFSVVVNVNSTTGPPVTADSILTLISMGNFTASVYFTEESKSVESGKLAASLSEDDSDATTPLKVIMLLHGVKSVDKTEFYWNGVMTLIIRGLPAAGALFSPYKLQATSGTFIEPLILTITSASVTMSSTLNTNATGESITWNGDFPVTLPQSPFYRKGPISTALNLSSQLTASAGSAAVSYKSELTWSNLSGKMIDSSTNDLQINGSLSFPVYYFPSVTVGPWPGPTIENWIGNFSVVVNVNSTTGPPVTADSILTLISMGNFTASVYFTEESKSVESGKLAASLSEDDSDATTPLKVIMLLHGVKSVDKTEFYWNGVMTLIIRGLPGVVPSSFVQSTYNAGIPSIPTRGSYISGRVTRGNVMGLSKSGKTYWWSGFFPVPIEMPAFDSVSPNAGVYNWPFVPTTFNGTGGVTWSGTISRETSDINAISIKGSFNLPIFVHGNPSAFSVDEWNGDFEIEMNLFNNSPLIDKFKSGVYNSPMIFREEPDGQGGTSSSYLDTINKVQNVMMTAMFASPTGTKLAPQPRFPIILWGKYSPDKSTFYWKGNSSVIFPSTPSFLFASKNKISADIDSEVTPPSKNVKLPFKILTGSLSVKSPVFGKKILWDGKIPFMTLNSYFNGPSANTSYIGGPMKWTGRITRSTDVVNGAHIEGIYSLPVIVHTNGGITTEAMTGDLSLSISFIGTRNLVDWVPNEGTYSSIITIAPGKPSDEALEEDSGPVVNMAINKLMKSMDEDLAQEDSEVMVLPACFFGDYDALHFTFTGDGITIVPANVSALVKKKHNLWDVSPTDRLQIGPFPSYASNAVLPDPSSRSLRQIYPGNDGIKNIKLLFKVLSGSLTSMSPTLGGKVLWDGQIPFTTPRSYFNHYSNSTSFIGGPMKWMGHISRTTGNGALIEGSFSVPIFVHSNDTVSVEAMTGDLSLQIRFSGTQNIVDLVPSKANFSTLINIGPAHPNIELSIREAQIESKSNMLLNMALSDIMNSIENENSDSDALIVMPIWLFGYYDAENFTFNGDALAIIPANLSNPAPLEYEAIVQDMTPATKLKVGAASPYISAAVTSGNVMGLSKGGRTFWWSATLPLPISMPPFDSVSPDAGVFNWPFNPTSYNGTGGVTWSGTIVTTTSVKNGINVKGSFTVPIFTHGNPSAFSVDDWNGDFELEMSVFYNNTDIGSSFTAGTYNSPMFFRERKTTGPRDPSGYDLKAIKEVENMMILSTNLGISGGINSAMPRVPVILWGNYSADKKVFYWEGNLTAVFPPIHNILFTPLSDFYSEKDSEDMSGDKRLRLPMNIITGKITSTSPVFGEKILWDGTIPFTTLQSYFSKYSTNSSFIGGPIQWAGQISRDLATANGAQIKGSFAVPIYVPLNDMESTEYLTGDFSFIVSFNGTQNIVDLVPNSGKFSSYIILGVSHDEFESYMGEPDDDEPSTQNDHPKIKMKQLTASKTPESGTSLTTAMPIIFLGNYGSQNFTFNGEAIIIIPEAKPLPANPKLLSSSLGKKLPVDRFHDMPYSKRNMPSSPFNDLPYSIPFPSHFKPKVGRKVKIFGNVKSGQIYGGNLGHRTRLMWEGTFPALIPMPAFDRRSHHNESHTGHPHHPHRMDGGITWEATEIGESRDGGYLEGNFFFPIYKHGRYHTYSIKMWTGQFSFHFTLPGDQSIGRMVNYWKRYTSKMYFHHFHSDWDLFNPGSHADELRDKANKVDNRINRSPNNGPIIILKGKQEKSIFSWSGKFILVFTV